jgi:hypothetical protein
MKIDFLKDRNAWYVSEKNTYFHMPFLKNSGDAFLKRVFKNDLGVSINNDILDKLRNPSKQPSLNLNSSKK